MKAVRSCPQANSRTSTGTKKAGFGFKDLKQLCYTVREIAVAVRKFFTDIVEQYDYKLVFGTSMIHNTFILLIVLAGGKK